MFDVCTNNLGESGEEVGTRSRELIATNEPAVITKAALGPVVVEDSKGDGGFPNSPCTNESNGFEVFGETGNLLDQLTASETGPGRWRRRFSKRKTTQM